MSHSDASAGCGRRSRFGVLAVEFTTLCLLLLLAGCAGRSPMQRAEETRRPDSTPGLERISETWEADPVVRDWRIDQPGWHPITVVYPRGPAPDTVLIGDHLAGIPPDSLFLFGHVPDPRGSLTVNDLPVPLHPGGGWLAWVPRGELTTRSLSDTVQVRETTVTMTYTSPSYEQEPATREITFTDTLRSPTEPLDPWPFRADTAKLVVTADRAKLRIGWPGTNTMSPAPGTGLIATGRVFGSQVMWRVPLGGGQVGWIADGDVTAAPGWTPAAARAENHGDILPPPRVIYWVDSEVDGRDARITVPLGEKRVVDVSRLNDRQLRLTVYGAVSWTDLMIQPHASRAVEEIRWTQVDSTTWALDATLDPAWFWGWETAWDDGDQLVWTIREAPALDERKPLRGVRIVVDPGHGGENYSAIGPTGYAEKTANFDLAPHVVDELEDAGAEVIITRDSDRYLGLAERVDFARDQDADLLVSLHHNGLPQGANPTGRHGASVHYVQRHAFPLAEAIYDAILAGGWPGNGLRYQDLALAGPSFCQAVLLEGGFLMHPGEEAVIRSDSYRDDMARWLREGIETYLARMATQQSMRD